MFVTQFHHGRLLKIFSYNHLIIPLKYLKLNCPECLTVTVTLIGTDNSTHLPSRLPAAACRFVRGIRSGWAFTFFCLEMILFVFLYIHQTIWFKSISFMWEGKFFVCLSHFISPLFDNWFCSAMKGLCISILTFINVYCEGSP